MSPRVMHRTALGVLALLLSFDFDLGLVHGTHAVRPGTAASGWHVLLAPPAVSRPSGIAVGWPRSSRAAQWIYVADAGTGRIVKSTAGGHILASWPYAVPGHPAVLAVGGAGNVFVGDMIDGSISKFSPNGARLARWPVRYRLPLPGTPFTDPHAIAVDPGGDIYLANSSAHRVVVFSPGGTLLRSWDTWKGLPTRFSAPEHTTGPLGSPTGVVFGPDDELFVSTSCVQAPACSATRYTPVLSFGHDVLLVFRTRGPFGQGVDNLWFGLGYDKTGTPTEMPGKESEVFVHIDAMAGDGRGRAVVAGTLWLRAGRPAAGVLTYSYLGSHTAPWWLPSAAPITGIAMDRSGAAYVVAGTSVLEHAG